MSLLPRYLYLIALLAITGALVLVPGCLSKGAGPSAGAGMTPLIYYTEQFPPYNYEENGTLTGISVDLLGEITGRMGNRVKPDQVRLVSWPEGYQAALTGPNAVLFSTARFPERENSFKWAGPIATDRDVLFARRDRAIVIRNPGDLEGLRIGVIADDAAVQDLLDIGVDRAQLVPGRNVSSILRLLETGDIDLWAYPEDTGRYFAGRLTGNEYTFEIVYRLAERDLYFAFSRDVPDQTVRSFQQALDALKAERDPGGRSPYERILGRYSPSIGLAQLDYLTEEWAPFNYMKDGTPAGIGVDMLEAVWGFMGVNRTRADVRIIPLADAFRQAQGNTGTVVFSIVRTPEREPLYQWAGPFTRSSFVLWAPVARNITISSSGDLDRYRIGAVKDSIENSLLAGQGVDPSRVVNGPVPADLLHMLEKGQIDLWATGDLTGRYEMEKAGLDPAAYGIVYTLSTNDFYYIFSRDVPDTLVSAFHQALASVRNQKDPGGTSEYERIYYRYFGVGCARPAFTDAEVMELVNVTGVAIGKNSSDTFRRINAGEAPYRDAENPSLYVFVFDTNVTVVAHAENILLVGVNQRGKTDVSGKPFRDEMVAGALAHGTGWVEYIYVNPVETGLFYKKSYYLLTRGSDGNHYIVGSGNFLPCG